MLAAAYDAERLVFVALHVGDPMSEAELQAIEDALGRLAAAVDASPGAIATSLVIVETEQTPTATQRRRIGDAAAKIERLRDVFVTESTVVRGMMGAIRWLLPASPGRAQATFATYEEARAWLVAESGHPAAVFDALHVAARDQVLRASIAGTGGAQG
jgi:hypothetical protein